MLIGEFTHTLDDKNRLSLPAKYRKELGKIVVVTPGLDGCLFLFTLKEWGSIAEKLSGTSLLSSTNRSFNRYMFGGATEVPVDTNGRILIPDFLKSRAGFKDKVVLVGVKTRMEIWSEKSWEAVKGVVEKEADALAEKLGDVGIL